jgi:hypothetical protein
MVLDIDCAVPSFVGEDKEVRLSYAPTTDIRRQAPTHD